MFSFIHSPPLSSSNVTSVVSERAPEFSPWGFLASVNRPINATTLNNYIQTVREHTEHRELILEPSSVQTTTCSCLSPSCRLRWEGGRWAQTARAVRGCAEGAVCVRGECQGANSYRTCYSLKNWRSSWIPALWGSHRWMKSGPTCT